MSSSESKKKIAAQITEFLKLFPQGRKAPAEELEIATAYADILSASWSSELVSIALRNLGGKNTHFAPSAGEIGRECNRIRSRSNDRAYLNRRLTHAEIAEQAKFIAIEKKCWPEFAAQVEWTKFREWFQSLGATKMRWFEEWPKWLDAASASRPFQSAEKIEPKQEFDPSAKTFSCYKLGMSMAEIIAAVAAHRRGDDWRALLAARGNR